MRSGTQQIHGGLVISDTDLDGVPQGQTPVGDLVAAIYEAAGALRQQGDLIASGSGQSLARWEVLYVLGERPRSAAQAARRLGRTRQSVQRVVDLLQAEGLIVSRPNPDNRRSPLFDLTDPGRQTLVAINDSAADWFQQIMQEFDTKELRWAEQLVRRVADLARSWPPRGGDEND